MKYIKMFESFFKKFADAVESVEKETIDNLMNYLYEIKDEFENFNITKTGFINKGSFLIVVKFKINELDKFKEVFHEGIFDRIKDDYPGTRITYGLDIESIDGDRGWALKSIKLKNPFSGTNNSDSIDSLFDGFKKIKTEKGYYNHFSVKAWIT